MSLRTIAYGCARVLTGAIGPHNTGRLDYIVLDAFPGVFQPISRRNLPAAVTFLLRRFRTVTSQAGVPEATPIHITETGWPTGHQRTESAKRRSWRRSRTP
jgi:exo-beta-1,3-glucanase (GH17 family)